MPWPVTCILIIYRPNMLRDEHAGQNCRFLKSSITMLTWPPAWQIMTIVLATRALERSFDGTALVQMEPFGERIFRWKLCRI
jgi:hypothetical protein